jgi:PAS domain S-box-containing protein
VIQRTESRARPWLIAAVCLALSAALLAIDLQIERRFALGIPQILVVLTALLAGRTWISIAAAAVATLAVAAGYLLSTASGDEFAALVNRLLAASAIWITCLAGLAFERGSNARRRLAEIVESSSDAILRVDLDGRISAWNAAAERIFGWRPEEVVGRDVPQPLRETLDRIRERGRAATFELSYARRSGAPLELSIAISPLHDAPGRIAAYSISARDIGPLKAAERALRELNDGLTQRVRERTADLRSLTAELLIVEERERRQLAQDLHDGLGQTLTLAIMRLGMLESRLPPAERGALAGIEKLLCEAQQSSTSLSFRLSPPILYDVGFVPAVQWLGDELERSYGLKVEIDDDQRPKTLDDHMRVVVFRCLRELLINVAKHAGTGYARVSLRRSVGRLELVVSDEGRGFDPAALDPKGFGMASIRERLEHLGGQLSIESRPGGGTTATLLAPLVRKRSPEVQA